MFSILPSFWSPLNASPLDGILRGVIGACGISVLSNLMRVHLLVRDSSFTPENGTKQQLAYKEKPGFFGRLAGVLHFLCLTGLLSLLGARASSLVVLEFSLRAVLAAVTVGVDGPRGICQFLIQCQFSLGCALSCSIHFLHEEAPHRTLSLLLAAGLSWLLWGQSQRLRSHVAKFYPLHSSERNCGACISLLNTRHNLIPFLSRAVIVTFAVGGVTAICTVNQHFLAEVEAMRFWTLLSLCYTLLLVYIQGEWLAECGTDGTEEQQRLPVEQVMLQSVGLRLGGLLVLLLMVGHWADVAHILFTLLGEVVCLLSSHDLVRTLPGKEDDDISSLMYHEDVPSDGVKCRKAD
ncbi:transmembrane protein 82-like isoform X2 [Denticeps clupeoides]|uniref:transmembrane protein 82-like isoform X2 n=1 Tax=Denticeps clupeoides TaxID=299321 RepID=UPI0010A4A529|nr:transmembrane protein 82-like isoform X2 [Denticeps clupeoides]